LPAEIFKSPGVFFDAVIAACVALMIVARSRPLIMISITERTFSGSSDFARGSFTSSGQNFS
jgi:hypothetical protein